MKVTVGAIVTFTLNIISFQVISQSYSAGGNGEVRWLEKIHNTQDLQSAHEHA